jgi:membrane protease YdiL (CAAX protease family)
MAIIFSWTLFFITDAYVISKYSNTALIGLIGFYGHLIAMMGPMLAAMIMLYFFQKDKLLNINLGNNKYYLYAICVVLIIWIIPLLLFIFFNKGLMVRRIYNNYDFIYIVSYLLLGWFAGMGEEYGWSGYILTQLSGKLTKSKAVVVSGTLRGLWHLPVIIIPFILKVNTGQYSLLNLFVLTIVFAILLSVSNIFFSALFGYAWYKTKSIPLLGWMHILYDWVRDFTLMAVAGFATSSWYKYGWNIPFIFIAAYTIHKIAKEDGYSNFLEIFYKKKASRIISK